jgi:prefoldin subunit 5
MSISAESIVAATDSTEISSKFLAIKAERERALEQVKVHKDLLSQLAIRDQNISEIVRMSSEVLAHTRSDTCPLCSHRYNSHEELVSKIFSNDGISPEQSSVLFLVENDEKTILELEKTLHDLLQKINALKKGRITYQNEAIEKTVKLIEENNDAITRITAQIEKIGEDESKLLEATGNLSKIQFQDTVDATIEYIESNIEKISSELKAFEAEAAELKESVTELESQIAQEKELRGRRRTRTSFF